MASAKLLWHGAPLQQQGSLSFHSITGAGCGSASHEPALSPHLSCQALPKPLHSCPVQGQGTAGPLGLAREVWDLLGDGVGVVLPVLVPPPDLAHGERTGEMGTLQAAFSWPC